MINDKFQVMTLHEKKIATYLFDNAKQAQSKPVEPRTHSAKYLVIQQNIIIPQNIFLGAPICPIFIYNNKSYIFLEGQCLWTYFLANKQKDLVLTEEQIWKLMIQICKALIVLRNNGYQHHHIRQDAIRRINSDNFRLVFHPKMNKVSNLIREKQLHWYRCYQAPEQLQDLTIQENNSCVFSIAAMVLNMMNPLDFKRDIYRKDAYAINSTIIQQKLQNASLIYSKRLVQIIRVSLQPNFQSRLKLEQLVNFLVKFNPMDKKLHMMQNIRQVVSRKIQKSREKRLSPEKSPQQSSPITKIINFQRGTFGGNNNQDDDSDQQQCPREKVQHCEQIRINEEQRDSPKTYNQYIAEAKPLTNTSLMKTNQRPQSQVKHRPISTLKNRDLQTDSKSIGLDQSVINMSKLSVCQQKQNTMFQNKIIEFKDKIENYHIKLSECLQPLQEIIQHLGYKGTWILGNIYYGPIIKGRRNGKGLQIFPNRQYYYGYFNNDLFHGEGFYYWHNCQYFLGIFQSGFKVQGAWTGKNKYVGQIKHNRRHGVGQCVCANGKMYEGQWNQGKYQGFGILTYPSFEKYIGQFRAGKQWGKGYFLTQGCRITGIWNDQQAIGQAEIVYTDGNIYNGMIKDFQKHGEGIFYFKTGSICKGIFAEDQFLKGTIEYKNGQKYQGEIRHYRRHGKGKYYYLNGKIAEGQWNDNKFISQN